MTVKHGYVSEMFVSFQGEGAYVGERHLFLRLAGCHLRCVYCDTPDSLERTPEMSIHSTRGSARYPNPVSARLVRQLVASLVEEEGPVDAISLTGGEPLLQSKFIVDLLSGAGLGAPILLETSGTLPQQLTDVLPFVDIVSMDLKLPSNTGEPAFWEKQAEFLQRASSKGATYIKVPVDEDTTDADFAEAIALMAATPHLEVFLQPIVNPAGQAQISMPRLHHLQRTARAHLARVRVVPQTHKFLGVR